MGKLLSEDFQAVWLLQSRVNLTRMGFWLTLVGYDPKTRSFESRLYLVYAILFFSAWIFATLTMLASVGGSLLNMLPLGGPIPSATFLALLGLSIFTLIQVNTSAWRSPFTFSEADAQLLCSTPLDRRPVALTWLLKDWLVSAVFVWTGAVVLGYALLEAVALEELGAQDLPLYFLYGLRMLVIVIPLHLGLHSLAWSIGALRLHEKRRLPWLPWTALLASIGYAGGWFFTGILSGNILPEWMGLLSIPIQAGLGSVNFLAGLGSAGLWVVIGISCLWGLSRDMSLIQAYQETQGEQVIKTAMWIGASDLAQELKRRRRLGSWHMPSRFLLGQGMWAVVSRNSVQSLRGWSVSQLAAWVMILSLSLGLLLLPGWEARAFMSLLWILAIGQRVAISVRNDLSHWWLMKQLPYKVSHLVMTNLALPLIGASLLGLLALLVASRMDPVLPVYGWLIIIPVTVGIGLAAVVDLLLQCRTSQLLAGITPDLTFLTIVIGVLVMGVSVGSAWLLVEGWALPAWGWIPLVVGITTGLDYSLFVIVQRLIVRLGIPNKS